MDDAFEGVHEDVELVCLHEMKPFQEIVMLDKPSHTLFVADLAFNLTPDTMRSIPLTSRLFCVAFRALRPWKLTALEEFVMWPYCKRALNQYESLLALPFENIVPCHGEVGMGCKHILEQGAVSFVREAAKGRWSVWAGWRLVFFLLAPVVTALYGLVTFRS